MFSRPRVKKLHERRIEEELIRTIGVMMRTDVTTQEYAKALTIAERLLGMMAEEKKPSTVSKEALLNVGANLLGILMIIKHEHVNVISSKALGFVTRVK